MGSLRNMSKFVFQEPFKTPGTILDQKQRIAANISWSVDIQALAKWSVVFGALLFVGWAGKSYYEFHGLFNQLNLMVGGDFVNDWTAARLVLDHHIMTLFDLSKYHEAQETLFHHKILQFYNWSYPPSFVPLIVWLGFFQYPVALILWFVTTFALYALAVAYKRPLPWGLILILAFAPSSFINIFNGQNGFLSAAFLVGGLRLLSTRPTLAGILFGLLTFKPQLGLLVPVVLVVLKKWRVMAFAAFTAILLIVISILFFGVEPWLQYIAIIPHFQQTFLESDAGLNWMGGYMMPSVFKMARIMGASISYAYMWSAIVALGAVWAVIYAFRNSKSEDLRNSVVLTATFLTSPYIFSYDMTIFTAGIVATPQHLIPR